MVGVQIMPATEVEVGSEDGKDLAARLDELLERYLDTLDAYQKAQQQLSKLLSSGYMSLAQANFNTSHTRYGKDYYDERMQASRRIALKGEEDNTIFSIQQPASVPANSTDGRPSTSEPDSSKEKKMAKQEEPKDSDPSDAISEKVETLNLNTEEASPAPSDATLDKAIASDSKTEKKEESEPKSSGPVNPIRWFGVLVPAALRSAQSSFVSAVEGPVLNLSSLSKELRRQEIEIGRVRKQIKKL